MSGWERAWLDRGLSKCGYFLVMRPLSEAAADDSVCGCVAVQQEAGSKQRAT